MLTSAGERRTSLANAIVDAERMGDVAVGLYCGSGVAVKFLDYALKFTGEACLDEDTPVGRAIDGIIGFSEVDEACVGWGVKF